MFDPTRPESNHRRLTRTYTSKLRDRNFFLDPLLSDPPNFFFKLRQFLRLTQT
ncbi:hypothetical protein HanRHA438_Chr03g0133951 [Helianthus annuus]|nr:hypothetical protein HanRHA438_Chr03g0133951 [Helianthus annuus]